MGYEPDSRVRFPGEKRDFLFSTASRPDLGPIQRILGVSSPEIERLRLEANHPLPSSAKVNNSGAILTLPISLP
jgi:hypothetical protein